jgi:hypothetical protein
MNDDNLQDFATMIEAKSRITFGDVRRLQRDYLPGGVSSFEEARILLHLDANVARTDRAWFGWLVRTIVDFVVPSEGMAARDIDDALEALLALDNASARARRRLAREIREARRRSSASIPELQGIKGLDDRGMREGSGAFAVANVGVGSLAEAATPNVVDASADALPLAA